MSNHFIDAGGITGKDAGVKPDQPDELAERVQPQNQSQNNQGALRKSHPPEYSQTHMISRFPITLLNIPGEDA